MIAPNQYLGRAKIRFDGKELNTMPGASINLGGPERKPVVTQYSVGFAEANAPGFITATVPISATTPIEDIRNIVDATVTFESDIGKRWLIRGAFAEGVVEVKAGDGGEAQIKLTGSPAEEV